MLHEVLTLAVLSLLAPLALAACGTGAGKPASTGHQNKQLALAQCMRAHGVTNFPDPGTRGGFSILLTPGSSAVTIDGTRFAGPTFTSAERSCKLLGGGPGPAPISERQKVQLVDFARCMRAHGVPDWADPSFPAGGGIEGGGPSNPADAHSPAALNAAKTCNRLTGL